MRELVSRYLDQAISRRGFVNRMAALGFTAAAANAILEPLEASETAAASPTAGGVTSAQGTGGELVVAQAKAAGVEYLFTNPGSFEVGFFDAVVDDPQIHLIMGLHEGVVISMADGYHRVSGKPAFVNVHAVAGTAQMGGQLYNASRDGSAIIVTAGLNDNQAWSDESILAPRPGFDQKEINRQFTKISWEARQPESLPLMLRRAFKVAVTEPGGPVYLAMAHYALESKASKPAAILPAERFMLRTRVRAESSAVERAAKLLAEAKSPVIVVGDEVWKSGAQLELLQLSESLGLPVVGAGGYVNFPSHHTHNLKTLSATASYAPGGPDLLLFIGARDLGGKVVPQSPDIALHVKVIRLGIDSSSMGRNYQTDVALVSDVKSGLADLRAAVESLLTKQRQAAIAQKRSEQVRSIQSKIHAVIEKEIRASLGKPVIHPHELGHVMAGAIDKDAILVTENLTGKYDAFPFGFRENEQMYIGNTGASLGWGIGAATGAKLAEPNRQVVCSIGDGALMYSASGFWSQVRYQVPVLTVVWNNHNYQTVRHAYDQYKGKMASTGKYAGMYLGDPDIDFVKLAGSQGVSGKRVEAGSQLEAAFKSGIAATRDGKPYLLEVIVSRYGGGADSTWHEKYSLAARRHRAV